MSLTFHVVTLEKHRELRLSNAENTCMRWCHHVRQHGEIIWEKWLHSPGWHNSSTGSLSEPRYSWTNDVRIHTGNSLSNIHLNRRKSTKCCIISYTWTWQVLRAFRFARCRSNWWCREWIVWDDPSCLGRSRWCWRIHRGPKQYPEWHLHRLEEEQVKWAFCQIRKIVGWACAGNTSNVFPATAG